MKVSLGVAVALALAACGDNSNLCGPGTVDIAGTCTGVATCGPGTMDDGTGTCVVACGAGTVLDPATGACQLDPQDCQDGTVLVGTKCVDPTHGLAIDVEEGQEPNGAGILGLEPSLKAAGLITLADKPVVIHGTILAADHDHDGQRDADVDTYLVTVGAATLVHLTATGLDGLDAGFYVAPVNRAPADILGLKWERYGVNLSGHVEYRDLYLPDAGTYAIAIASSKSLLDGLAIGDAPLEYYVSLTAMALPTPTPLTDVATGVLGQSETKFFLSPMGTGINDVAMVTPTNLGASDGIVGAVTVASVDGTFRNTGSERIFSSGPGITSLPAEVGEGGFKSGEQALIVVDMQSDVRLDPSPFRLTVKTYDAVPIPASGTVSPMVVDGALIYPDIAQNYFQIDVATAGQVDQLSLMFSKPVDMVLLDQHFRVISPLTWLEGHPSGFTTNGYSGLIRFPIPNTYYIGAYPPNVDSGNLTATASLKVLPEPDFHDMQSVDSVDVATYTANAPWQRFTMPADVKADFYNVADAYGRLDPITIKTDTSTFTYQPPFSPMFSSTGGPLSRIVLDDPSQSYFVRFHRASPNEPFTAAFDKETYTDVTQTMPGNVPLTTAGNYFMRPTIGAPLTFANDVSFLNADTSVSLITREFFPAKSWAAFTSAAGNVMNVSPLVTYSKDTTTVVPFEEICDTNANKVAMRFDWDGGLDADVEINSDDPAPPILAPDGFHYFGAPVGKLAVSTDGWISFDYDRTYQTLNIDPTVSGVNNPIAMSGALFGLASPFWEDLWHTKVCAKSSVDSLIIEWQGQIKPTTTAVKLEAILYPNSNIAFVYPTAPDCSHATIGIESPIGNAGTQVCFDNGMPQSTSVVFTPSTP